MLLMTPQQLLVQIMSMDTHTHKCVDNAFASCPGSLCP